MNWYDQYRQSMGPAEARKIDFKRWIKIHKILCERLGVDLNDTDNFYKVGELFAKLTEKLDHLPRFNEFFPIWKNWEEQGFPAVEPVIDQACQNI